MKLALKFSIARAFTLIELIVIISSLVVLVVLVISGMANATFYAKQKRCVSNLKQVGLAFRTWSVDSLDKFAMRIQTNQGGTKEFVETGEVFRHFQVMSNELQTPNVLVCPADFRQPALNFQTMFSNTNISYFVGVDADETDPQMLLSGDRNITNGVGPTNGVLIILTNQIVGWSHAMHKRAGSLLIADGHVDFVSTVKLRDAIRNTGVATNRLAIP